MTREAYISDHELTKNPQNSTLTGELSNLFVSSLENSSCYKDILTLS